MHIFFTRASFWGGASFIFAPAQKYDSFDDRIDDKMAQKAVKYIKKYQQAMEDSGVRKSRK